MKRISKLNHRSRGMTLIELMVAITLGLLLVAVIIQIYIGSRATYIKQEDLSRLQENARESLNAMGRDIRMAWYTSLPGEWAKTFPAPKFGFEATDGGAASDSITVRFQGSGDGVSATGDNATRDCLGAVVNSNIVAFNRFYIAVGADGQNALFCDNTDNDTEDGTEIISHIDFMKVLLGVDNDASGNSDANVDYYVPASVVVGSGLWNRVASVRIGIVASTPNPINNTEAVNQGFDVFGTPFAPVGDRRSRRLFTYVVSLRNRTM